MYDTPARRASLRTRTRAWLEDEIETRCRANVDIDSFERSVRPIEHELNRRDTHRLTKWMVVAVVCNAVFIAADIVLRLVLR